MVTITLALLGAIIANLHWLCMDGSFLANQEALARMWAHNLLQVSVFLERQPHLPSASA